MRYDKGTFVVVPNLEKLQGMHPIAQVIYMRMCKFSNEEGVCFPSQKTLADKCGISIDSCRRYILELENCGILAKERRYKDNQEISSIYAIVLGGSPQLGGTSSQQGGGTSQNLHGTISTSLTISNNSTSTVDKDIGTSEYTFEMFWKDYPHARPGKKQEAKEQFNKQKMDDVKDEVVHLKRKVEMGLQDAQYLPACQRWIRDFITTSDIIKQQNLKTFISKLMETTGDKRKEYYNGLCESFGKQSIDDLVKQYSKQQNKISLNLK